MWEMDVVLKPTKCLLIKECSRGRMEPSHREPKDHNQNTTPACPGVVLHLHHKLLEDRIQMASLHLYALVCNSCKIPPQSFIK